MSASDLLGRVRPALWQRWAELRQQLLRRPYIRSRIEALLHDEHARRNGCERNSDSYHDRVLPTANIACAGLGQGQLLALRSRDIDFAGSALRRRYRRTQNGAGVRPLRFEDLRHTFGSLLAAGGVDVVRIKAAVGHSALATTASYRHARPAVEQAQALTRAFRGGRRRPPSTRRRRVEMCHASASSMGSESGCTGTRAHMRVRTSMPAIPVKPHRSI